jgi:tRNA(Ile)-lysidine synthase
MLARVAETVERFRMFARGQRVGVAVSGGADSVCLLHVLQELAPRWDLELSVLHVDHRLRGAESDADAQFVSDLAARLGLEIRIHQVEVRGLALETGDNLEQAARQVRRAFFLELIRSGMLDRVALGHTRSDQAETVLFRFLRGSGTMGLAGMRPCSLEGLVRPLIQVGRAEVEQFLRDRGIAWREDSSNRDPGFARNRIRHDLLPALKWDWNPALEEILARAAQVAQDEEDYWRSVVEETAKGNLVLRPPAVLFRADWLAGLNPAVARRVTRAAIQRAKGDLRRIDLQHVEQILELARSQGGEGRRQIPGLEACRSCDWMRLAPPTQAPGDYDLELAAPGSQAAPGSGCEVELELLPPGMPCGYNEREGELLDWGRISGTLRLRNGRRGDRYRPVGHATEASVRALLREAGVPRWERRQWPLLTCGGQIVWVARFGPAAECAATPESHSVLRVREIRKMPEYFDLKFGRWRPIVVERDSAGGAGGGGL